MTENFGSQVPQLVNIVCSKIAQRQGPEPIETELKRVLDDDAIPLTVRLWTLLHHEISLVE